MVRAGRKRAANSACWCFGFNGGSRRSCTSRASGQVVLQALLLLGDALVEPGVFNGDGDLRGQRDHGALVVFVEVVGAGVLHVEHADHLALVDQRHGHLRPRFGIDHVVAGVLAHIGHMDQPPLCHRHADQAAVERNLVGGIEALAEAHGVLVLQHLLVLVEQPDGEHLVVDDPAQELADALEQRVEVED